MSAVAFESRMPLLVRLLGGRWTDGRNSWRMKWGELSVRSGWLWALSLNLFGDECRYSLHVQIPFLNMFISLPFLKRWQREPHEMMETWGFSYSGECGLHLNWGRHYKIFTMPWLDWEQTSHDVLRPDGTWSPFVGSWETGPLRVVNDKGATIGGKEPDGRLTETHEYRYLLDSGEVQIRTAECHAERRIRRLRWLRWTKLFQRTSYSIDVRFSDEVGEKTGSWKGGVTGCGWTMKPDETIRECLKRMERERKF